MPPMRPEIGRLLLVAAVLIVLVLAAAWAWQRRLIYFPDTGDVPAAASVLRGGRDVELETADGLRLGAWHVPARGSSSGLTVLVAPGNAGNRGDRVPLAAALAAEGLGVLLLDYRGYGGNPGRPSEEGLALDVRAARTFLVEDVGVPADHVVYFGESLGAAVVTELATEHRPAALVLRSPFESLAAVARAHYPFVPTGLLRDDFAVARHVGRVHVPTVVVYGTADSVVPADQSRAVAQAANRLHRVVEIAGADHNDRALLDGDQLVRAVVDAAEASRR